jgi:hypothetical protein
MLEGILIFRCPEIGDPSKIHRVWLLWRWFRLSRTSHSHKPVAEMTVEIGCSESVAETESQSAGVGTIESRQADINDMQ